MNTNKKKIIKIIKIIKLKNYVVIIIHWILDYLLFYSF